MIETVDGRVAPGGSPAGLGSALDQELMARLRAEADALLHGAGTLRADRFSPRVPAWLSAERIARGQPPQPTGVVVSASGALDPAHPYLRTAAPDWPRIVYSASQRALGLSRPGLDVVLSGGGIVDLDECLADLHRRGVRLLVCEGGPHLNGPLFARGLVDELFVTVAPRLVGGVDPLTLVVGPAVDARLRLASAFAAGDELLLRYCVS